MFLSPVHVPHVGVHMAPPTSNDDEVAMAGIRWSVSSGDVALTAATQKTVLQVTAPANQRLLVDTISLAFDGVTPTNEPVSVHIYRQTNAGSGGSAYTPKKLDNTHTETVQATALYNITSEPTYGDLIYSVLVHPQSGIVLQLPENRRLIVPGGTRLGVVLTAPNGVNANCTLFCEE